MPPLQGFLPPSQVAAEIELRPARFNDRFIAYVIDVVPFAAGYAATLWGAMSGRLPDLAGWTRPQLRLAWAALCLAYQFFANASGGSIGKRLMGLRIVRRDGGRPTALASLLRTLGWVLSAPLFNLGFLIALAHPESRALDDLMGGTLVVEAQPKPEAESWLLFFCALVVFGGLCGAAVFGNLLRPSPADLAAVASAKQGLLVLAQVEEAYKTTHGTYTGSLPELALASGNAQVFQGAMLQLYLPDAIRMEGGPSGYRISAQARDRRRSRVEVEGPPPRISVR